MLNTLPFEVSRNGGEEKPQPQRWGFFIKGRMLWFARKLLKCRSRGNVRRAGSMTSMVR
jgi:hypothetical protein